MKTIKLLIAADHPVVRQGLTAMLGAEPDLAVLAEASDSHEALSLAELHRPEMIILDFEMPGLNGCQTTEQLLAALRGTKVLILSAYASETNLRDAVAAGASAYILKSAASEDLVNAIREVKKGKYYFSPSLGRYLNNMAATLALPAAVAA